MGFYFKKLDPQVNLPAYATYGAAGMDICSNEDMVLDPAIRAAVKTGISYEIPSGWQLEVRPRSGLALKHGVTVLNAPGTLDSDYTGEIKIILINHGPSPYTIVKGDRIAQLVLTGVNRLTFQEKTDELTPTERGAGGFGSSGK